MKLLKKNEHYIYKSCNNFIFVFIMVHLYELLLS